jgi:hypothetical protein
MKSKILIITMSMLVSFSFANCDEKEEHTNPLVGIWVEKTPCNECCVYTITENEIHQKYTSDETLYVSTYEWITADSIRVKRLWLDNLITTNKIIFYSNDSILIKNFTMTVAAVYPPQFIDVTLIRKEN